MLTHEAHVEGTLRLLFVSDWRLQPIAWLHDFLERAAPVDALLYGGDEVARFGLIPHGLPAATGTNEFSRLGAKTRLGVFGVLGNDCEPDHRRAFDARHAHDLHQMPARLDGWGLIGIQGGIDIPDQPRVGFILHTDTEIAAHLERASQTLSVHPSRLVVVSHAPPARSLDRALRFGANPIGSEALRTFVEREQPALVLCGHVHNAGGRTDRIGNTLVVNAASSDSAIERAFAALLTLRPGARPEVQWLTKSPQRLTSLPEIGFSRAHLLESAGFTTRDSVIAASDAALQAAGLTTTHILKIRLQQLATEAAALVQFLPLETLPADTTGAVDVETGITEHDPWMIGLSLPREDRVRQWTVPDQHRRTRAAMYAEMLDLLQDRGVTTLVSWGGNSFDKGAITFGIGRWAPHLLPRWHGLSVIDLTCVLRRSLALPAHVGWSLDLFAPYCGADIDSAGSRMTGLDIGMAYDAYLEYGRPMALQDILRKNRVDVEALALLLDLTLHESFHCELLDERPDWQERLLPTITLLPTKASWRRLRATADGWAK